MEQLPPEVTAKLDRLEEDNKQLRSDLRKKDGQLRYKDELLAEYEQDVNNLRSVQSHAQADSNTIKELQSQNKYMRELLDEQTTKLASITLEVDSTKRQLADAQKLISALETPQSSHDYSFPPSEPSNSAELAKLQDDLNEALFKTASTELREKALQDQYTQLSEVYNYGQEENQDLKKNLKELKKLNLELECQLSELRSNAHVAKQGNSMFGEVADEYKKLEDDMKEVVKKLKLVARENAHLKNELEEARLLARGRECQEKIGRCVCDELKPELEQQRVRGDHLERKIHTLETQLYKLGKNCGERDIGKIFQVTLDSLKSQLNIANKEVIDLRIERNTLKDKNSSLTMLVSQAENQERIAMEEVNLLKTQIELIRHNHAKEMAKLDNPELYKNELTEEPKVSGTFKSAADTLAKLKKSTIDVKLDTPARLKSGLQTTTKTPAFTSDQALKRLTLNNSASQSLLNVSNTTLTARERRLKKGKQGGVVKQLVNSFNPIQIDVKNGKVVKVEPAEGQHNVDDTMIMFGAPSEEPPIFKTPSVAPTRPNNLPTVSSISDRTDVSNKSMVLETTQDIFEVDLSKDPFDDIDSENDVSTI